MYGIQPIFERKGGIFEMFAGIQGPTFRVGRLPRPRIRSQTRPQSAQGPPDRA